MSARLPDPSLTRVYRLEATLGEPLDLGDLAQGRRRIVPLTGGTFAGPELNGKLLPGSSADWQTVLPDGTALGDIRYTLETDEGDLLYVQSRSMRHGSADVLARLARGEDVDASEYTFRTSTQIETAAPGLEWLNKGVFIGVGARQPGGVIYENLPGRMTAIKKENKMAPIVSRGFRGRRAADVDPARVPPGQYVTQDFPVLSAGPTPHTSLELWDFSIVGELDEPRGWTWEEFRALPSEEITRDIHCVTKWSKLDTVWRGVSVDTLLEGVETSAAYVMAYSDGGYTTNLPLEDVTGGKAWVVFAYAGQPLAPEHGGPARMLVPQHYFWKSAKWVRGLLLQSTDEPGFWETNGYHNYGDPWQEQRYAGD